MESRKEENKTLSLKTTLGLRSQGFRRKFRKKISVPKCVTKYQRNG